MLGLDADHNREDAHRKVASRWSPAVLVRLGCWINPTEGPPMTDAKMSLRALIEKTPDADLLREMIGFAAQRLMELEVGELAGAAYGEKSTERLTQRNGYRDRLWDERNCCSSAIRSSCVFRSSGKAATFPAFWVDNILSTVGWRRRRSPR
jgi:hypothetical protein